MKVKSESEVAQSCLTLSGPVDCSPPGSSIHGIFQARVLEWGAIAFSGVLAEREQNSAKVVWLLRNKVRGLEPMLSLSLASDMSRATKKLLIY